MSSLRPHMPAPNKGGQPLSMCTGCFGQKLTCWTNEVGHQKKVAKAKELEKPEEESDGSKESDGNRQVWMERFSMMKVGPPKGAKPVADQNKTREKPSGAGDNLASPRRPVRTL